MFEVEAGEARTEKSDQSAVLPLLSSRNGRYKLQGIERSNHGVEKRKNEVGELRGRVSVELRIWDARRSTTTFGWCLGNQTIVPFCHRLVRF